MPDRLLISVIIVTYNRIDKLKNCLEALRNQTLLRESYEVIVVDDGSSDGTKEYLKSFRLNDQPRVRYYLEEHRGLVAARNFGVSKSLAKYVSFTDDDCLPEPEWLEKVLETFAMNEAVNVVGAVTRAVFENQFFKPLNSLTKRVNDHSSKVKVSFVKGETGLIGLRPFSGCNLHITREVFNRLGGFNESIQPSDDIDFMYRYLRKGGVAANRRDMNVDHYERGDLMAMYRRWVSFGNSDPRIVKKYFNNSVCLEVDLFHGRLDYIFLRFASAFPFYLQLNLFKLCLIFVTLALVSPVLSGLALVFLFGGLFFSQKNPVATLVFLVYTFFVQASYTWGTIKGMRKNKMVFL